VDKCDVISARPDRRGVGVEDVAPLDCRRNGGRDGGCKGEDEKVLGPVLSVSVADSVKAEEAPSHGHQRKTRPRNGRLAELAREITAWPAASKPRVINIHITPMKVLL
jgi:hypothetical protein